MQDEYLDLVNEEDKVIGRKRRSEVYKLNLSNFRVINVFIKNSKDQLWIPRRGAAKRIYPLCLDMSVGGHVESGESYEDALEREIKEEINIDVKKVKCKFLKKLTPKDGVSAFMKIYEILLDKVDYNKNDFVEFFWLTPKEALEKIKKDKAKSDLPKLVRIIYLKK